LAVYIFSKGLKLVYNLAWRKTVAFDDILGNARIKRILRKSLIKSRLPNSLLFSGIKGVGKFDLALVIAKALNCQTNKDDACETCASCKAINKGTFPDVMLISPEKEVLKIDQIRVLKEAAYLRPMMGSKRVFIIEQAEKMNPEAANSLLKVLEEPPSFSYIVLLTNNPFIILPTIRSRCQNLQFSPVSREDIESCLIRENYDRAQAKIISLLVRGNLKQALALEWEEIQTFRQKAWELFQSLIRGEKAAAFLKEYSSRQRALVQEELNQILEILSSFCRDLILVKEQCNSALLMNPDYEDELGKLANQVSLDQSLGFLEKIEASLFAFRRNVNLKLFISSMIANFMDKKHV
jgi:DNA polymerase III delta' subunit